jgi:predicted PurR-regulated permease PerM
MNNEQIRVLVLYLQVGLKVLSARIVLILTLLMVFSLFCWAMYDPTYNRIACAGIFAILVYLPVVSLDRKESPNRAVINPNQENQNE